MVCWEKPLIAIAGYLIDMRRSIGILPRATTGPHFQHSTTKTPNVNLLVVAVLNTFPNRLDNLWRHPKDWGLQRGVYAVFVAVICPFIGTKAGDFTDSVRIHKNVVSRQIMRRENPIRIMRIMWRQYCHTRWMMLLWCRYSIPQMIWPVKDRVTWSSSLPVFRKQPERVSPVIYSKNLMNIRIFNRYVMTPWSNWSSFTCLGHQKSLRSPNIEQYEDDQALVEDCFLLWAHWQGSFDAVYLGRPLT